MSVQGMPHGSLAQIRNVRVVSSATNTGIDTTPQHHGTLSANEREYYMERRRALLTELRALNKLLGRKTE